jgi:hypothetical protein
MDYFCLTGIGIRVGYASPAVLAGLAPAQRRRVQGRVVLALTANPFYALSGVRAGAQLTTAARRLAIGPGIRIGLNTWYLAPDGPSRAVFKVRHGTIQEIGIADRGLTGDPRSARRFLSSFS